MQGRATLLLLGRPHPSLCGQQRLVGLVSMKRSHALATPPDSLASRQKTRGVNYGVETARSSEQLAREIDRRLL